jgi:dCTP deaminase
VFTSQELRHAATEGWIGAGQYRIIDEAIQPASIDLRLGRTAYALRCSFLPDTASSVREKAQDLAFDEIHLDRGGAVLERDRPYLIPLLEELALPVGVRGRANPKSSTGRLDVFTRVITNRHHRFDEVQDGYRGGLFLEVVPRSFAIRVEEGLALNQLRLMVGDAHVGDQDLRTLHSEFPLLYLDSHPMPAADLSISNGLFLSVDLDVGSGPKQRVVGYRAKRNSLPIDLSSSGNTWSEYFDPVHPEEGSRIVLEPEVFYLLLSEEGVCIPPGYAAEMMAYDPTAGELRTHYAGFFDPGFGFDGKAGRHGSRAALEVRARDVPFMVEHRQPICKLAFERLGATPDVLYGEAIGSSYQGQETMLSKHFTEQTPA